MLPGLPLVTLLTPNRVKRSVYELNADYVRSLEMIRQRWGASGTIRERLWNHAAMLLRPDAIVGRRAAAVFPALRAHGFIPVAVRCVALDSPRTSALWIYQSNVSTPERLRLMDRLMTSAPSVYVVLRDLRSRTMTPATVHATYIKGATVAAKRKRDHLRSLVGPPIANLLSYIHMADDPADLVREMAVLFDAAEQAGILAEIDARQDRTGVALRMISQLEARLPDSGASAAGGSKADGIGGDDSASQLGRCDACTPELLTDAGWKAFVEEAINCKSFISGETYDTRLATVPDDKRLSLPVDTYLIRAEFGLP
ncbi:nucleoside-diphosphate kinase [Burkholderia ubonensis]|uniref:nucleoside-diphosphate kinase n=1 Tax=Burkholderia ubonensis TaxID=101571 RepID=UPI000757198F|nr:nucleoside-diphosphate kinase [Burkholderia ubonensis]KVW47260.1 hypothetical protein WK95_06020 [Burkholderia ubonensis]